jgi:cytoskeletal protein CcmA (bactofilin family)
LFGKKKAPEPVAQSPEIGLLGAGTKFVGKIRFRGTLRLDGSVRGDIRSEQGSGSVLVINRNATVTGSIVSDSVLISGEVEGDVIARASVEIFRNGSLKGDIYTGEIMIESGAEFQGGCHMIRDMPLDQQRDLLTRVLGDKDAPARARRLEARADSKGQATA